MEGKLLDPHLRPKAARVIAFSDIDGTIVRPSAQLSLHGSRNAADACACLQVHYPKEQVTLACMAQRSRLPCLGGRPSEPGYLRLCRIHMGSSPHHLWCPTAGCGSTR